MSRGRILVVEDDAAILAGLREKLGMEGYEVLQALDGEEARERLAADYDVADLDSLLDEVFAKAGK
jgi:DNA-binding response OmpR family regulator